LPDTVDDVAAVALVANKTRGGEPCGDFIEVVAVETEPGITAVFVVEVAALALLPTVSLSDGSGDVPAGTAAIAIGVPKNDLSLRALTVGDGADGADIAVQKIERFCVGVRFFHG
jgi:hypothetical protein